MENKLERKSKYMKKFAAVALALVMLMAVPFGYAEEAEMPYEGEWVEFEDTLTVYLPSELADVEISEELQEGGVYYIGANADSTRVMQFAWVATETEETNETLLAQALEQYGENAGTMEINGLEYVYYVDEANDLCTFMYVDPGFLGVYSFTIKPASDDEFATMFGSVLATVEYPEAAE